MLKVAICDDEEFFRIEIRHIVSEYMKSHNLEYEITMFSSGEEFVELRADMGYFHIVYLDINMDGLNGIETAKKLRLWCKDSFIVFVTAFVNYTLDGYKVEAIRYILKNADDLRENVEESLDIILKKMDINKKLYAFQFKEGKRKFSAGQIVYAESNLHTISVYVFERGEEHIYTYSGKLDDFEKEMNDNRFVRVHQSFLINMKYIAKISGKNVILQNKKSIPIARARSSFVKEKYLFYEGEF